MKPLPWPNAIIVVTIVVGVVLAILFGKDSAALIGLAGLILAGIGVVGGVVSGVRDNTNGNISKLINTLEGLAHRLGDAPAIPRAPELPVVDGAVDTDPDHH
jgi:hypothetical protein